MSASLSLSFEGRTARARRLGGDVVTVSTTTYTPGSPPRRVAAPGSTRAGERAPASRSGGRPRRPDTAKAPVRDPRSKRARGRAREAPSSPERWEHVEGPPCPRQAGRADCAGTTYATRGWQRVCLRCDLLAEQLDLAHMAVARDDGCAIGAEGGA